MPLWRFSFLLKINHLISAVIKLSSATFLIIFRLLFLVASLSKAMRFSENIVDATSQHLVTIWSWIHSHEVCNVTIKVGFKWHIMIEIQQAKGMLFDEWIILFISLTLINEFSSLNFTQRMIKGNFQRSFTSILSSCCRKFYAENLRLMLLLLLAGFCAPADKRKFWDSEFIC